jgi:hypothetical protein
MACQEGWFDCHPPTELPWQRFLVHGDELDLEGLPDEEIDLRVESVTGAAEAHLERGKGRREATLQVAGTALIRGRAMHESGNPVLEGKACLSVPSNGDVLRCVPIDDGRFELPKLAPRALRLTVSALGMVSYVRDVDLRESARVDLGDVVLPDKRRDLSR